MTSSGVGGRPDRWRERQNSVVDTLARSMASRALMFRQQLLAVTALAIPLGDITLPAGFNDQLNILPYWSGTQAECKIDPYDLIDFTKYVACTEYYVNFDTGNNADAGTSSADAWKTLDYAIANAVSPAIIYLEDEWIGVNSSTTTPKAFSGQLKLISVHSSGRTRIVAMNENNGAAQFAFAPFGAAGAYVSTTAASGFFRAQFDSKYLDPNGIPRPIVAAADAATCEITPGTYFWDAGASDLYVHMWDGRIPDPDDGWIYCSTVRFEIQHVLDTADATILLENIEFASNGGASNTTGAFRYRPQTTGSPNAARVGLKNCLAYGASGNGFQLYDASIGVLSHCHAAYNHIDGFNYHTFIQTGEWGGYITYYEYKCTSHDSGFLGWTDQGLDSSSSNGSTAHEGVHIIRISCQHQNTNGAVVADVNGTFTVCLYVQAGQPGAANPKACFWHDNTVGPGNEMGMYLFACAAHDNGDDDTFILSNIPQSGGSPGQIYIKYWMGQVDGAVFGQLKDWNGNDIDLVLG